MLKKITVFLITMLCLSASIEEKGGDRDLDPMILEKPSVFKYKWSVMNRIRKIKNLLRRFKIPLYWRLRKAILTPYFLMVNSLDALAVQQSAWAADPPHGCFHTESDGAVKAAYSSALYQESWPSSADGIYTNGQTINGDMNWSVGGVDRTCKVSENKLTLDKNITGTTNNITIPQIIELDQKQSLIFDIRSGIEVGRHGGILIYGNTGATSIITLMVYNDKIRLGLTNYAIDMTTERRVELVMDFIEQDVICYIDGTYALTESMTNPLNAVDKVVFYHAHNEVGSIHIGNIFIADTLNNIGVQFSDSLNEDTLSDYTLGGDTNPTYDSTEKAIELRDVTNLANQTSIAYQDFDCPQDEIVFKFQAKIGTNDSSTDGRLMDVRLRSKVDTDTYVAVYYNGANIFLENVIDGAVSGTGNIAIALGNTSHDFEVIIRLQSHVYLFIDTIEYVEITPTKIKRFYDGQGYFQSQHDAGEESEIFIKNIAVDDSPIVNASRSTPPGLLTSGTRVDVGNTFWEDYAGEWSVEYGDTSNLAVVNDGLYGNRIKYNNNSTVLISGSYFAGLKFTTDAGVIIGSAHTLIIVLELDNVTNIDRNRLYIHDKDSNSMYYDLGIGITAGKMVKYTIDLNSPVTGIWTGSVEQMLTQVRYSSDQTVNMYISDMYFIGEPEHDIRGQPLYSNAGIEDIDEYTLGGDTSPGWNTDRYELTHTNVGGAFEYSCLSRSTNFNPNGVGVVNFSYQIQADDTTTYASHISAYIFINGQNMLNMYYDSVGQDWNIVLKSNNVSNYSSVNVAFALDNAWHDVVVFYHKDHGITLFIDEKQYNLDTSITGTWVDWTSNTSFALYAQNDTLGQKVNVDVKDISIERHPLNIHQMISNEVEELTDTLAPSGTDLVDGDWRTGFSVSSSGNPITDGKFIRYTSLPSGTGKTYDYDTAIDGRRFDKISFWIRGAVAGSYRFNVQTSSGNYTYYAVTLAANTWTYVLADFPNTDDPVADAGWTAEVGTYDPSSITSIFIRQQTGSNSTTDIYGLQFWGAGYADEHFVPQQIQVKDHSIDAGKYGAFYMGSNEKARLYYLELDGHAWIYGEITYLDFPGAGLGGEGTWQSAIRNASLQAENNSLEGWGFREGIWDILKGNSCDMLNSYGTASVRAYNTVSTATPSATGGSLIVLWDGVTVNLYCGSATASARYGWTIHAYHDMKLEGGAFQPGADIDGALVNHLTVASGATLAVQSTYKFYYRKLTDNGTTSGNLLKWGPWVEHPPADETPDLFGDLPYADVNYLP